MKMKDYWFLAFVRFSNEYVFENQLGEQNDSTPPLNIRFALSTASVVPHTRPLAPTH